MLFLSIADPKLLQQIPDEAEGVELRLDLFPDIDVNLIEAFLRGSTRPTLLTLRSASQGGKCQRGALEREALIKQLLALEPPFFDLECTMRPEFLHEVLTTYAKTQFILSHHNSRLCTFFGLSTPPICPLTFGLRTNLAVYLNRKGLKTPSCLNKRPGGQIFRGIQAKHVQSRDNFQETPTCLDWINRCPIFTIKVAATAFSTNDALRMLIFAKKHPNISVICMGEGGRFARVLGPVVGNLLNFASVDSENETGPGQLSLAELVETYRYPTLNPRTEIYGLIGAPVTQSPGHLYHNAVFRKQQSNSVYVKMALQTEELAEFIPLAKELGIRGLSVTMPLKEAILPFVDELDEAAKRIGAVNTLLFKNGKIFGTNTDGFGALDAIEKRLRVQGKKVVLLGAGGAARAIAFEAISRGADVLILNRTLQRAKEAALNLGCRFGDLREVPADYDILINCTSHPMPIDPQKISPHALVMDVMLRQTQFLQEAKAKGCQVVYAEEMFLNQAAGQTAFWMGS